MKSLGPRAVQTAIGLIVAQLVLLGLAGYFGRDPTAHRQFTTALLVSVAVGGAFLVVGLFLLPLGLWRGRKSETRRRQAIFFEILIAVPSGLAIPRFAATASFAYAVGIIILLLSRPVREHTRREARMAEPG